MEVCCVIFGMKHKKNVRDNGSKAGTTWRFGGISNRYTSREIYWARDIWAVHTMLTVRYRQPELTNSCFGDHAHRRLHSVCYTCKTDGKINLNEIYR